MQNATRTAAKGAEMAATSTETMAKQVAETVVEVLDKLEGKQSSVRLTFDNLNLDTGYMKSSVNGAVVLTMNHPHE